MAREPGRVSESFNTIKQFTWSFRHECGRKSYVRWCGMSEKIPGGWGEGWVKQAIDLDTGDRGCVLCETKSRY